MYVKLFQSIYQGTLRGNSHGLLVFTNLLAHTDRDGNVDLHPRAIAEEVGLPLPDVQAALATLEGPDPESRTPDEEGRRIVRLDEHRSWGWRVVNYAKYRSIRNEEERREANREAVARHRAKAKAASSHVIDGNPKTSVSSHREADREADGEAEAIVPTVLVAKGAYSPPNCPFETLLAEYHALCPSMTKVRILTNMRMKHCRARWLEVCNKDKATEEEALEFFRWYFRRAEESDFLSGRRNSGRPWKADFEWLMTQGNWAKVIEGKYSE